MPPDLVSLVFHVYFLHGLLVCLSTCISGGYHVMVEPIFPSYVYSTCVFNFLRVLGHSILGHNTCKSMGRVLCVVR